MGHRSGEKGKEKDGRKEGNRKKKKCKARKESYSCGNKLEMRVSKNSNCGSIIEKEVVYRLL